LSEEVQFALVIERLAVWLMGEKMVLNQTGIVVQTAINALTRPSIVIHKGLKKFFFFFTLAVPT